MAQFSYKYWQSSVGMTHNTISRHSAIGTVQLQILTEQYWNHTQHNPTTWYNGTVQLWILTELKSLLFFSLSIDGTVIFINLFLDWNCLTLTLYCQQFVNLCPWCTAFCWRMLFCYRWNFMLYIFVNYCISSFETGCDRHGDVRFKVSLWEMCNWWTVLLSESVSFPACEPV